MTVLLVDDDPVWRYVASKFLLQAGIGVLEAAGGAEALALCRRHDIDMLITDVMMPGMSGIALAECVAREFPEMQILFLTAGDSVLPHPAVSKSDTPEDLVGAVRRRCLRP